MVTASPDGKLYDAYVSHATAPDDRKFVHFIVKPQLENRYGYKLFLDEQNILPNAGRHPADAHPALCGAGQRDAWAWKPRGDRGRAELLVSLPHRAISRPDHERKSVPAPHRSPLRGLSGARLVQQQLQVRICSCQLLGERRQWALTLLPHA